MIPALNHLFDGVDSTRDEFPAWPHFYPARGYHSGNTYVLEVATPGMSGSGLSINIEGQVLCIEGGILSPGRSCTTGRNFVQVSFAGRSYYRMTQILMGFARPAHTASLQSRFPVSGPAKKEYLPAIQRMGLVRPH